MSPAFFGTETEYAVTAFDHDGRVLPVERVLDGLLARAARRPSLCGNESGIFLTNGGRFYVDVGGHPEYASPESCHPWDATRHALAGDVLMRQLAEELTLADPTMARLVVRKGNVDYAGQSTWASHENYLHERPPVELRPALVPHLVSRIVFTGSGGFDPFNPGRASFVLSPRALFMRQVIRLSGPGSRALVDERAQPHCAGFHRQHLMCGDANWSHLSMFLRLGTTALVVALADAGCDESDEVALAEPLQALAAVARDTTLRQPLLLASGRHITALGMQRHYLRQARQNRRCLPPWASAVCDAWEDTLDRLAHGPDAVADRLDWAIKRAVFRDRASRRRSRWLTTDEARSPPLLPRSAVRQWRAELCAVDLLFGRVYPPSLFETVDETGALHHRVPGIAAIGRAVTEPPAEGRARIRGEVVARLSGRVPGAICAWDGIRDLASRRELDLTSPFAVAELWRALPEVASTPPSLVGQLSMLTTRRRSPVTSGWIRELTETLVAEADQLWVARRISSADAIRLNNDGFALRNAGRLEDAEWLMRAALAVDRAVRAPGHQKLAHRRNNLGTVLLMLGRVAEARQEVTLAWQAARGRYDLTSVRVLTIRLTIALMAGEPIEVFLGQLKSHLAIQPLLDFADVSRFWQFAQPLEMVAPALDADAFVLLKSIGDVINGDRPAQPLDEVALWRNAVAVPLDVMWPSEVAA